VDLPCLGETSTTKDIDSVVGDITCKSRRLHLEECNLSSQVLRLFFVVLKKVSFRRSRSGDTRHVAHLVRYVLEPGLLGFDLGNHVCEPKLSTGLLNHYGGTAHFCLMTAWARSGLPKTCR
jgi:hypothetical protein